MTFLKNIVPAPLLSAALFALWLALARSTSAGQLVLGLGLALAVPLLTSALRLTNVRARRPLVVVRFILRVGYDVLLSNFEVAWGVVTWQWRRPRSRFVIVPLELRDPVGLAALSMVTTVVPGTVWSELALDRRALLLHVWDVGDEGAFVARFKARYEEPLREIFE
ncbi:Na+/H+ antiporter subunit E [Sorangium sp. So ce327]|uniref:Na+/H+ antiporter subunit E n=1 Tax=Sorangium sp. So ce327 TaxID=3133301 RepID=UPI003F6100CE